MRDLKGKVLGTTVYASKTGVEISATAEGKVKIRAFRTTEKGKNSSIYVFLSPLEAHKLGRYLHGVMQIDQPKKYKPIVHKFSKNYTESISSIEIERWERERDGKRKTGYALLVSRDGETINIPLDKDTTAYLGDLLKFLALEQSWMPAPAGESRENNGRGKTGKYLLNRR